MRSLPLIAFYLAFFVSSALTSYGQQTIEDSLSVPVEIRTSRSYQDGVVSLGRSQFLSLAGSFDDPSRLLIKYPGISTANDQANSVIYHGLPSHYHQWQLYGARILNPNHLSNAGTQSDNPSRSSGGVNMMSGQVIGSMKFYGNPSSKSLNSLAGNSDVTLRTPYRDNTNLNVSLIGMEAGIDRVMGESNQKQLMLNYRYSTVGLLTDLGLDFGGEVIKYQDVAAKYSVDTEKAGHFDFYGLYGRSSNNKDTISPVTIAKDQQQIAYSRTNVTLGVHHSYDLSTRSSLRSTLNISSATESRKSSQLFSAFREPKDNSLQESMLSLQSRYQVTNSNGGSQGISLLSTYINSDYSISNSSEELHLTGIAATFADSVNLSRLETMLTYDHSLILSPTSELRLTGGLIHNTESGLYPMGSIDYRYQISKYTSIGAKVSHVAQELFAEERILLIENGLEDQHHKATHVALPWQHKALRVSPFYHYYHNTLYSQSEPYSSMDLLDNRPLPVSWITIPDETIFPDLARSTASAYGVDISYRTSVYGITVTPNLSLIKGQQQLDDAEANLPFGYSHIANVQLSKKWQLSDTRHMGLSVALHHRGGAYQNTVDIERSRERGFTASVQGSTYEVQLANYWRADMRLYYIVKRGKYKSTISLDIQNVTNRLNDAFYYYEPLTDSAELQRQLGLLPVLSWRVSF